MAEPFMGQITMYGFNWAIRNWAMCNGQLLPIAQNTALFSLLGTVYGGDGRTTYGLPDMEGRVPVHMGNGPGLSPYRIGEKGGAESVTLTPNEMPSHSHTAVTTIAVDSSAASTSDPTGAFLAGSEIYGTAARGTVNLGSSSASTTVENTGGGRPHTNIQPFICVNFQIAMQGLYPSRS